MQCVECANRINEIRDRLAYLESTGEPYSWLASDLQAELDYLEESFSVSSTTELTGAGHRRDCGAAAASPWCEYTLSAEGEISVQY
jgi:hypothetical protein